MNVTASNSPIEKEQNQQLKMDAEAVVACLFRVHLRLDDDIPGAHHHHPVVRGFRDLFMVPSLAVYTQKTRLLAAAERTGCAAVIMDVLLFLSQTMAKDAFHRELSKAPTSQQHWIQYVLSQQQQRDGIESGDIANEARVASLLSTLLVTKTRADDVAIVLLELIFKGDQHSESLLSTLAITKVVLRVAKRTKPYRLPQWTIDLLEEFIELSDIQLETERRDAFRAPPAQVLSGYMDKRARGATNVNANWRMRYFQLSDSTLSYGKHDADKLAQSRNPFLDKRVKGTVALTRQMPVQPLNYAGKVSRRPHCIAIGHGEDALIIDACTPVVQSQWMAAIAGNIRRLELDDRWLRHPRPNVHRVTLHQFIEYALFYHSGSTMSDCDPDQLATKFKLNDKRLVFLKLVAMAERGDWSKFESVAFSSSKTGLFSLPSSSSTSASSSIGYGAMLDIAERFHAPLGIIAKLDALYEKHEIKKPLWICHSKMTRSESDGMTVEVDVSRTSRTSSSASS